MNRRVEANARRLSLRSSQRHLPEASVKIEKLDDFLGRARKLARLADAGKPILESFVISFEDPADNRDAASWHFYREFLPALLT